MRTAALSIAVLLGIATLTAQAHATPVVTATVTIENDTVQIGGKRGWSKHGKGGWSNRHWSRKGGWSKRHWSKGGGNKHGLHGRKAPRRHFGMAKRFHRGRHHRPAVVVKQFRTAPVVIVKPGFRRSFVPRGLPPRPLIKNGSFARRSFRW